MVHTAKICYVTKEYLQLIHPEITMCDWQDVITHLLINEPSTNKKVMFVTCPGQSLIHLSRLVSCFFRAARVFLSTSFSVHRIIFSTSHNQAYRHTYPCLLLSQIWLLSKNFVCLLLLFFSCRYEQHQSLLNRPSWFPPPPQWSYWSWDWTHWSEQPFIVLFVFLVYCWVRFKHPVLLGGMKGDWNWDLLNPVLFTAICQQTHHTGNAYINLQHQPNLKETHTQGSSHIFLLRINTFNSERKILHWIWDLLWNHSSLIWLWSNLRAIVDCNTHSYQSGADGLIQFPSKPYKPRTRSEEEQILRQLTFKCKIEQEEQTLRWLTSKVKIEQIMLVMPL